MRTISYNVYKFGELDEQAKVAAINNCRDEVAGFIQECDADEYRATLGEIESRFNIDVYNWSVDEFRYSYRVTIKCDYNEDDPRMLLRYLNNQVFPNVNLGEYYSTPFKWEGNKPHYKSKRSRVVLNSQYSCCLTGCWCDDGVDDALNHAYDAVRKGWTIREFVDDMLERFFGFWKEDMENAVDDDTIAEHITINDYEFHSDGRLFS